MTHHPSSRNSSSSAAFVKDKTSKKLRQINFSYLLYKWWSYTGCPRSKIARSIRSFHNSSCFDSFLSSRINNQTIFGLTFITSHLKYEYLHSLAYECYSFLVMMGRTMLEVWCSNVRRQKWVFEFDVQWFSVRSMLWVLFDEHLGNIILPWNMLFQVKFNVGFAILKNSENVFHENDYAKSSSWYLIRITKIRFDWSHFRVWKK